MKLKPKLKKLASKIKSMGIVRGLNMEQEDILLVQALVDKGLVKKESDHKHALTQNAAWMFKYTATDSLKELGL